MNTKALAISLCLAPAMSAQAESIKEFNVSVKVVPLSKANTDEISQLTSIPETEPNQNALGFQAEGKVLVAKLNDNRLIIRYIAANTTDAKLLPQWMVQSMEYFAVIDSSGSIYESGHIDKYLSPIEQDILLNKDWADVLNIRKWLDNPSSNKELIFKRNNDSIEVQINKGKGIPWKSVRVLGDKIQVSHITAGQAYRIDTWAKPHESNIPESEILSAINKERSVLDYRGATQVGAIWKDGKVQYAGYRSKLDSARIDPVFVGATVTMVLILGGSTALLIRNRNRRKKS